MDKNKQKTNKYAAASLICGISGIIISILMYACQNATALTYLAAGIILAVLSIIFANLANKREPQNRLKTAGFVLAVITLIICMSQVWIICLLSCLSAVLHTSF